ncbi:MAG TPA: hypothetical protein VEQ11_03170, partial [Chloroflexota bacterium]|nr:hypothetical protein [Chloroflexota bacterium]
MNGTVAAPGPARRTMKVVCVVEAGRATLKLPLMPTCEPMSIRALVATPKRSDCSEPVPAVTVAC